MDLEVLRKGLIKYYPGGFREEIAKAEGCSTALVSKVLSGTYPAYKPNIIERAIQMLDAAMEHEKGLKESVDRVSKEVCPECHAVE